MTCSSTTQPLDGQSHQSHGESVNRSVSQSTNQLANQPNSRQPQQQSFNHTHHAVHPRSMYLSHPLELSVTPLATLSISTNSLCHCAFTHSRSTSHALNPQACCLSCHYLSCGSTHSCYPLIMCDVPSGPVLSYDCYLTPLPISHALTLTLSTCSHAKAKCLLSFSPSHTCRCLRRTEVEDHDL